MKRLFTAIVLVLGLTACAQENVLIGLTTMNDTITAANRAAKTALVNDFISVKEACTVEQYSRLAARTVDEAYLAYSLEGEKEAEDLLQAAKQALQGASTEAVSLVNDNCSE